MARIPIGMNPVNVDSDSDSDIIRLIGRRIVGHLGMIDSDVNRFTVRNLRTALQCAMEAEMISSVDEVARRIDHPSCFVRDGVLMFSIRPADLE